MIFSRLESHPRTIGAVKTFRHGRADPTLFRDAEPAVFSDGSFVYVPPCLRCPMELRPISASTSATPPLRAHADIATRSPSSLFEAAPTAARETQCTSAVSNVSRLRRDQVSTVQKWIPAIPMRRRIYNSSPAWRLPRHTIQKSMNQSRPFRRSPGVSELLLRGEIHAASYTDRDLNGHQQVDTGTKMIHLGKNTTSRIISKGIAAGVSQNTYRGLVTAHRKATGARNFTACDSLLIGDKCGAHTVPYIEAKNSSAHFEHEATTSKISEDVLFYCVQRGLSQEEAVGLVVNGFVKDVLQQLPMEFAVEAQKLISISLEGSVG